MTNLRKRGLHYKPPVKVGRGGVKIVKRRKLKGKLRKLWICYHGICGICGEEIVPATEATIDHITPLSRGGTNHQQNLQLAHAWCNRMKGSKVPDGNTRNIESGQMGVAVRSAGPSCVIRQDGFPTSALNVTASTWAKEAKP